MKLTKDGIKNAVALLGTLGTFAGLYWWYATELVSVLG